MGGGGNKTSTTDSGVPDWAQPYLEGAAQDATGLYDSGALDNVAGLNADQNAAAGGIRANTADANTTFNQAQQGQGIFGADAYGGASSGLNAYNNLAASGQAQQDQTQAEQDAQYQGIQRLFGLINPGTVGSTQTTNSTGGK